MPLYSFGGGGDNFANADLTLDANRTHYLNGNDLTINGTFSGSPRTAFKVTDAGSVEVLNSTTDRGLYVQAGGVPNNHLKLYAASNSEYIKSNIGLRILVQNIQTAAFLPKKMSLNSTTFPSTLYIRGEGSTSATTSLLVENSSGTDLFKIDDSGGFALGIGAIYGNKSNVAIGENADAEDNSSPLTAIGLIAIGYNSSANGGGSVAIGGSGSSNSQSTSIGFSSFSQFSSTAIGYNSNAANTGTAIGHSANSSNTRAIAIGNSATSSRFGGLAIGYTANVGTAGNYSMALGAGSSVTAGNSILISAKGTTQTNSTANTFEVNLDNTTSVFRFGNTVDGWLNSTGNFGIGKTTGINEKLDVDGNITSSGQTYSSIQTTLTPSGTTETIDWDNGNFAVLDLGSASGDVTLTLSNAKAGASYFIKIIQGATARDVIFPSTVKFAGQTAPYTLDVTATNGAVDAVSLAFDGTDFIANFSQNHG